MEIKLIICFSFVIPTISFQWLKILLVTLLFFIFEYIFLKQFVKLLIVKYTCLLNFQQWLRGRKIGKTEIQKFEHLENEKSFLDEIKNIFHSF